jgi:putative SOS response-associated peptidase YedK
MCGRTLQSSGPICYAFDDGMNVRDTRFHNYPPRRNGAPSQELLVIRRNHQSSLRRSLSRSVALGPHCLLVQGPERRPINAKCETVRAWIRTFAIITTDANALVADIHDRMVHRHHPMSSLENGRLREGAGHSS